MDDDCSLLDRVPARMQIGRRVARRRSRPKVCLVTPQEGEGEVECRLWGIAYSQ